MDAKLIGNPAGAQSQRNVLLAYKLNVPFGCGKDKAGARRYFNAFKGLSGGLQGNCFKEGVAGETAAVKQRCTEAFTHSLKHIINGASKRREQAFSYAINLCHSVAWADFKDADAISSSPTLTSMSLIETLKKS